ncbi:DEAD/DEAH box helicase [Sulfolobus islandicus]|uniref:CRISPR-associated, Cas3, DEAD-like helicase n=2 Tax=Saccharolobus islandicus TaxID=43080 RepID=F0NNS5_SACI0|nr:CRISPR-associated, Cas3, DEAD-like helicase [Sulfolobus islandicus HVE10/4]WCM36551.1 DEAD/DEAH box helicase [Sulfolobus islandicus]
MPSNKLAKRGKEMSYVTTINDTYIEEGETIINGIKLRKFQEELFDSLGKYDRILLRAPTGSGKTFTLILGAIKSYIEGTLYPVVGIYPSRALVYDQARSVNETLTRMGLNKEGEKFTGRLYINGEDKGDFSIKIHVLTSEVKEIPKEFQFPTSPSIIFTVPEYPYMFMTGMNKQNVASQVLEASMKYNFEEAIKSLSLRRGEVRELLNYFSVFFNGYWFIDEFHLYSGIARNSMLTLVEMYEKFNSVVKGNKTIVFSSATPVPININKVLDVKTSEKGSKVRKRTRVIFHLAKGNPQEELVNYISEKKNADTKTAVIIDRVYYVAELCKKVNDAAVVWGLDKSFGNCRKVNKGLEKENFIIGNQAMSFGIDLDLDEGFIHAHDAETLIQRLGRFGRHGEGEAEVLVFIDAKAKVVDELRKIDKELNYDDFLNLINKIYERRVDDKLDEIFFSKIRHDVLIRAFSLIYAISQGEQVYNLVKSWYPQNVDSLKIRPAYEDYFYVFAYRPGNLKGQWCDGGSDELFSMIRNFKYREDGCFTNETLKESPGIIPRKTDNVKCSFMTFEEFNTKLGPRLVLKKQGYSILMGGMKEFKDSYVVLLTKDCVNWNNFSEMAKLVSTYENAIPIYKDDEMKVVIGLALFI